MPESMDTHQGLARGNPCPGRQARARRYLRWIRAPWLDPWTDMGMGGMDHGAMVRYAGMAGMDHSRWAWGCRNTPPANKIQPAGRHAAMEPGGQWDDPGIACREQRPPGAHLSRPAAVYLRKTLPWGRDPTRHCRLHLTRHMGEVRPGRSMGVKFSDCRNPCKLDLCERRAGWCWSNETMMAPTDSPAWFMGATGGTKNGQFQVPQNTPSTCLRPPVAVIASTPMPWGAGLSLATCCSTWENGHVP